jgi:hypothetical protein
VPISRPPPESERRLGSPTSSVDDGSMMPPRHRRGQGRELLTGQASTCCLKPAMSLQQGRRYQGWQDEDDCERKATSANPLCSPASTRTTTSS